MPVDFFYINIENTMLTHETINANFVELREGVFHFKRTFLQSTRLSHCQKCDLLELIVDEHLV